MDCDDGSVSPHGELGRLIGAVTLALGLIGCAEPPTDIAGPAASTPSTSTTDTAADTTTTDPPTDTPRAPTYDELIELLRSRCARGEFWTCDGLFNLARPDSPDEDFGASCGDRLETGDWCVDVYGVPRPADYGDDPLLDELWDLCASDRPTAARACDDLYVIAYADTEYLYFGASCAERFTDLSQSCEERMD